MIKKLLIVVSCLCIITCCSSCYSNSNGSPYYDDGYAEGYADGENDGYRSGYDNGYDEGYHDGYNDCYQDERIDELDELLSKGYLINPYTGTSVKSIDDFIEYAESLISAYENQSANMRGASSITRDSSSQGSDYSTPTRNTAAPSSSTVYVSKNGVIHRRSNCSGMKHYTEMDYNTAVSSGYRLCSKCY